jgi:hypothetical protein
MFSIGMPDGHATKPTDRAAPSASQARSMPPMSFPRPMIAADVIPVGETVA